MRDARIACLSVDVDGIDCYAAIHGIELPSAQKNVIYDVALRRFEALFDELKVPATFFVIGRDLQLAPNRRRLARLAERGHEVANHSYHHAYDLSRKSEREIYADIQAGSDAIEDAVGQKPVGFRAPGYTMSPRVFDVLAQSGYAYDSSVFPCPAYFSAKAAAMAAIRVRGRTSQSILGDPRFLAAPADPYRIGTPYWTRGGGLLELPIGVTRDWSGRLPYIGTALALLQPSATKRLTNAIVGRPLVNLEMHGIDLADAAKDQLEALLPHQPDLRKSFEQKRASFVAAVETLRAAGYRFSTLAEAAQTFY